MKNLTIKKYLSVFVMVTLPYLLMLNTIQAGDEDDERYKRALDLSKAEKYEKAIPLLQELRYETPGSIAYLSDYIQVLSLAGKDREVIGLADDVPINYVRAYVLEAVARSARNLGEYQQSKLFYQALVRRFPERVDAYVGLAFIYSDQSDTLGALDILFPQEKKHPDNTEVKFAIASVYERDNQLFEALKYYDNVLALNKKHRYAIKRRILVASKLGNPILAHSMAKLEDESMFSPDELAFIRWDEAAYWVRWGEAGNASQPSLRFDDSDKAIDVITKNIAYAQAEKLKDWEYKARFDLLIALRDRVYMEKVVVEAKKLLEEKVKLPLPSIIALADAYLYLEQPKLAEKYYLSALKKAPKSYPLRLSLFSAYLEGENYEESKETIEGLAKEQARRQVKKHHNPSTNKTRTVVSGNPNKTQAEAILAVSKAYFSDLGSAEREAKKLSDLAPHNTELRTNLGTVYSWRGWPRRAQEEYEIVSNIEPENVEVQIALARNYLELRNYQEAEKQALKVFESYPENKDAQKEHRRWGIHNSPEILIEIGGSKSKSKNNGAQINGSKGLEFDAYLFSSPLDYNFRAFAHYRWTKATFEDGSEQTHHQGVGVEYTRPSLKLTAEIQNNDYADNTVGLSVGGEYQFNDQWSASASLESFGSQTPLRALKNKIYAHSFSLSGTYRQHESREFGLAGSYLDFTDGNTRLDLNASYFQSWYSGPTFNFATYTSLFNSNNSKTNVPYFSPKNQRGAEVTFEGEWLSYQSYDTNFHQRLGLTVGRTWQQEFENNFVYSLAYDHRWKALDRFELLYGVSYGKYYYDGDEEFIWQYFMRLDWRF